MASRTLRYVVRKPPVPKQEKRGIKCLDDMALYVDLRASMKLTNTDFEHLNKHFPI